MAKKVNYFTFNGENYYVGTIVVYRRWLDGTLHYARYTGERDVFEQVEEKSNCRCTRYVPVMYQNSGTIGMHVGTCYLEEKYIVEIVHPVHKDQIRSVKYMKDTESNDMFDAWVYYILFMLLISVTTWNVYGWILGSVVFWRYRHDKLYKDVEK